MPHADPATLADLDALVDLMHEFYAEAGFALDRAWAARSLADLIDHPSFGGVWLIRTQGQVAGYVVLSVRYSMEHGGLSACIDDLFVRPTYRRCGAARAGLDALVDDSRRRGCLSLHVEVGRDNAAAVALYQRYGLSEGHDGRLWLSAPLPDER